MIPPVAILCVDKQLTLAARTRRYVSVASVAALMLVLLPSRPVMAWSDHATLLRPLLRTLPALTETRVTAEPLADFVNAQAESIERLLAQHERWSTAHIEQYAAVPPALRFDADSASKLTFVRALRINPQLDYALHVRIATGEAEVVSGDGELKWQDLSRLPSDNVSTQYRYRALVAGEAVSCAAVVASASDEPDMGMDVGLFDDNGTGYGADYAFGQQPFGNPNLSYGSQAPFHMGFYHLDWLTKTAQPNLLATYPIWRITQYQALAALAFDTGHDYWGWRFLGWALHYLGDLAQPYHAVPLPGVTTLEALWLVATGKTDEAVQLVSNRHGVLESFQYTRMSNAMAAQDWQHPLLQAAADTETAAQGGAAYRLDAIPASVEPFQAVRALVLKLSADSVAGASALDNAIESSVPARLVSDPSFEWVGSEEESQLLSIIREQGGDAAIARFDRALSVQLKRFAQVAQAWLAHGMTLANP